MKTFVKITIAAAALLALAACAAGSADSHHAADGGVFSLLLLGFWHGLIAPITLIVELINAFAPSLLPFSAHMYETKAASVFYDLGFYLGLAGGPGIVIHRSRRVVTA